MPQRHAILILGMHRSGTSALTRVLNLLGAELGGKLMPATADNPHGYWEDASIIRLNDECLSHFGLGWDDVLAMPQGWVGDPWLHEWQNRLTQYLSENYADATLAVIKDPRLCRLLPAWLSVLARLNLTPKIVMVQRLPGEVALSLQRRDAMDVDHALLLCSTYLLDAERDSRRQCRAFIDYQALLDDWRGVTEKLSLQLELTWPSTPELVATKVESFIDAGLRHRELAPVDDANKSAARKIAESIYHLSNGATATNTSRCSQWDEARAKLYAEARNVRQKLSLAVSMVDASSQLSPTPHTADWLEPADIVSEVVQARLYYRAANTSLEENNHVAAVLRTNTAPMHATFEIPAAAPTDFIRFDPAMYRGIYRLLAITIDDTAITLDHIRVSAVHERLLAAEHGALLRFLSDDTDPYVEFDIRALNLLPEQPMHIEFVFERDSLLDMLRRQMRIHERSISHALKQAERKHTEMANLQVQTQETLARINEANNALLRHNEAQDRLKLFAANWDKHGRLKKSSPRPRSHWGLIPLTAVPTQQLRLLAQQTSDTPAWWSSDGGDPHFHLTIPGHRDIAPGWYVLSMDFCGADGSALNSILYVDYNGSFDEANRLNLAVSAGTTRQRMLVRFTAAVRGLRFDPSDSISEFLLSSIHLRRISKVEVLARLSVPAIRRMHHQGRSWRNIWHEGKRILRGHGLDRSIETLYSNRDAGGTDASAGYHAWVDAHDTLSDRHRDEIRSNVAAMSRRPLISVLLPVYNPPDDLLRECLDSVLGQLYPHWELCIADDASPDPHVRVTLAEYAKRDPRIKVVTRKNNGHISAASNSALELVTGEFTALLDHDDLLPEHALYYVAETILEEPGARLIYSDEDKISETGSRFDPYFKSDWNPDLLYGHNMISHLGVYQTQLMRDVGGFRAGYEGSQDYDLALRCVGQLPREAIVHIPRVLYHWRAIAGSTALAPGEKTYAHVAAQKSLAAHFERKGIDAEVLPVPERMGNWRIHRAVPQPTPSVSIIIPTRDGEPLLRRCIDSVIAKSTYPNYEIVVVNNQSSDPNVLVYLAELNARDRCRVIDFDEAFNFSRLNNVAAQQTTSDVLLFLNNDTQVISDGWIEEMVALAVGPDVGAVGAMLYYPDDRIQHAGVILGLGADRIAGHAYHLEPRGYPGDKCRAQLVQEMSAVTAACMAIKRDRFDAVGGFDEALAVAFNDIDLCLRLTDKGYYNVWTPNAELYHYESCTRGSDLDPTRRSHYLAECAHMRERWGNRLLSDPYYHPALSLDCGDFVTYASPRNRGAAVGSDQ